ncbi:MAG: ATP-binding protein [Lachnospiraceae bacterium]|nr:ATP-binding protein [Lachnospiraceae bacterium]
MGKFEIVRGKQTNAVKTVVYGVEGIGKSTLASCFPNPLFIDIEGSTGQLDVARFPAPQSWAEVLEMTSAARGACDTLVLDSIDWAERLAAASICARQRVKALDELSYGRGFSLLATEFERLLAALDGTGLHVVLVGHARVKKIELPDDAGAYDRWTLALSRTTEPLVKQWADLMLFCNYRTSLCERDGKRRATGQERVMFSTHTATHDAKCRFNLPDEMSLQFEGIAPIFAAPPVFCADCGAELLPYRDSAGREVSVERHVARSRAKFGKVCCLDCINAARAGDTVAGTEDADGR